MAPADEPPVFKKTKMINPQPPAADGTLALGKLPDSDLEVRLSLGSLVEYHCAVLGVTGTGKTEVSLDLVRAALDDGAKVVCVDLTGEYEKRLEGIPAEKMDRLFERFTRGDASRNRTAGSTGLGLAIAHAVVGAHGGTLTCTSRPGRTVFTVTLPSAA